MPALHWTWKWPLQLQRAEDCSSWRAAQWGGTQLYINMDETNSEPFIPLASLKLGSSHWNSQGISLACLKKSPSSHSGSWSSGAFQKMQHPRVQKGIGKNSGTAGPRMILKRVTRGVVLIFLLNYDCHYHSQRHNVKPPIVELPDLIWKIFTFLQIYH